MGNKQRGNGVYQWQQRLLRLGRKIVEKAGKGFGGKAWQGG